MPDQAANTQHIYVSESQQSEDGTQITVTLSYKLMILTLRVLALTVNFDNSMLSLDSVSGVASGAIASGNLNDDGDALIFAWSDHFWFLAGF